MTPDNTCTGEIYYSCIAGKLFPTALSLQQKQYIVYPMLSIAISAHYKKQFGYTTVYVLEHIAS